MRIISILAAVAVCAITVTAEDPRPTIGHTATLIDNTVFIQGGSSTLNTPQNSAFSLILGPGGALKGSTMLDITTLSKLGARDFHSSVATIPGIMVNCGGIDGASGTMTCDDFNPIKYTSTPAANVAGHVVARGGMAVAVSPEFAYFLGGSGPNNGGYSAVMDILTITSGLNWRTGTNMPVATRFHTATWVDGATAETGFIVVLGGQIQSGAAVALDKASVFTPSAWADRAIAGGPVPARFGHTAVNNGKGVIYVYGGKGTQDGPAMNDVWALDTKAATWTWAKINVPAEPRAFHASVLLPDDTILHTFGQSGPGIDTAVKTFSLFNPAGNGAWVAAANPPAATVATESPNKSPDTSNNPNDPNFKHSTGENGGADGGKSNGGMIAGIVVGLLVVLVGGGLLFRRHRARARISSTLNAHHIKDDSKRQSGGAAAAGGAGLNRAFTIRKPQSVYVEDDQELDQTGHPHYTTDSDARNNPYYGDRSRVVEYELSDTSGQKYGPGNVAERKRYVEQQQRQVMDEYEMFNNHHQDRSPKSPYSQQTTIADSFMSSSRSPPTSSRSPRTHHQQQESQHQYSRNNRHDSDNYNY